MQWWCQQVGKKPGSPMMLSADEAKQFLTDKLKQSPTVCSRTSGPGLQDLEQVVRAFHFEVPFQNLTLLAKPRGTQDVPTPEEIKEDVLSGFGGLCYTNNVFMAELLAALGLDSYHLAGVCNPKHPNNHILTLVKNLTFPDSLHFVDVGCGYPTYQVISADFAGESGVYSSAFLQYKFKRDGPTFQRIHQQSFRGVSSEKCCSKTWERFYDFELSPRSIDYFQTAMTEVYSDRFLRKLRLLVFKEEMMLAVKEDEDSALLMKLTSHQMDSVKLRSDEEIVNTLAELATVFEYNTLKNAVKNWKHFKSL